MLSDTIKNICARFNFRLADRNASDSWVWNGRDLALWNRSHPLRGDVWTFPISRLLDHDVLHELCHFLAAAPEQRDLPEFGLDWGIVFSDALGPRDGTYRARNGELLWTKSHVCGRDSMRIVDKLEGDFQELIAQYLSIFVGVKFDISPALREDEDWDGCKSWENYRNYKSVDHYLMYESDFVARARSRAADIFEELF